MKEITKDGYVLARVISPNDVKEGLSFFSQDSESIQVGTWKYNEGKELLRHIHKDAPRQVLRTQEVLLIRKGRIEATIYDLDEKEVEKVIASEGDILILLDSGHGYRILDDATQIVEIKNGPYLGAEADRRRF